MTDLGVKTCYDHWRTNLSFWPEGGTRGAGAWSPSPRTAGGRRRGRTTTSEYWSTSLPCPGEYQHQDLLFVFSTNLRRFNLLVLVTALLEIQLHKGKFVNFYKQEYKIFVTFRQFLLFIWLFYLILHIVDFSHWDDKRGWEAGI